MGTRNIGWGDPARKAGDVLISTDDKLPSSPSRTISLPSSRQKRDWAPSLEICHLPSPRTGAPDGPEAKNGRT